MSKFVLIADDDPKNVLLAKDLLEVLGCETQTAVNGREAVDMARARRPDLILMDIQMPVMNGVEATQTLRADPETAEIPIIAVTASVMAGQRAKVMESGVDGFMAKPIDVQDFMRRVKAVLAAGRSAEGSA